jgi:adenylate cyclase class IV
MEWLPQVAYSKRCSVNKILGNEKFIKINENRKLNDPQKMAKIRDLVFTMKFPNFMRAKESWKKLEKNTNPDPVRVQFKPSEAFEKNRLEIRITVADPENIKEILDKLHLISGDIWKKLIYPFQDN